MVCSDLESRYGGALTNGDEADIAACRREAGLGEPVRVPGLSTFADSVEPLEGRVSVRRIPIDGTEVLPGIRFIPTPGHSIRHASIEVVSNGEAALFSSDVLHHPTEIYTPDLLSVFREYPVAARLSRRQFMDHAIDTHATVFASHFPRSSAGQVTRNDEGYAWEFTGPTPA